jgi:hypothetical protein
MRRGVWFALAFSAFLAIGLAGLCPWASAQEMKVVSDRPATGFKFPESVAYDPKAKALYVSEFGSELKPAEKDGKGRISKVSLDGKILDEHFLPTGSDVLNKPKGLWVDGSRLWVTDIDVVWVFDLETRKGRKAELPGIKFANDVAVKAGVLYVSDNRADQLYRVEPADFLDKGAPKVTRVFSGKSVNPNGLWPARDGSLLMVGFMSAEQPRGIYAMAADGEIKTLAKDVGRLDGLYEMDDGSLLFTDWNSGSLVRWSAKSGKQSLASGFKGPADFCVVPEASGLLVVVPDLAKSELRLIRLSK